MGRRVTNRDYIINLNYNINLIELGIAIILLISICLLFISLQNYYFIFSPEVNKTSQQKKS